MQVLEIPLSIIASLLICLICILVFLRFMGKTQVSQMTPLDTVNAFVIGAMVSGVVYDPDVTVWHFVWAIAVWMLLNYAVRFLSHSNFFSNLVFGKAEYLIKNGIINLALVRKNHMDLEAIKSVLRERDIYSLTDVKDLIFERDGNFSVTTRKNRQDSCILIDNGEPVEDALKNIGKTQEWLDGEMKNFNLAQGQEIFALDWTPGKGFYIVDKDGNILTKAQ
ncbi:MAG: DUF421 domain-containing protein [Elusimicrobiota bacterium]|jgi:uncharacterized membrane protein YcaP (DUF421 family)|nr:DUF421 domain-containing protein [Elusimicrobiota bacterium]